ncbi:MAG: DNA adenine methylase [Verrucomicrobia bacterium]|nr:DNA adenine methylase [Verrucomicrobiota bacterium]
MLITNGSIEPVIKWSGSKRGVAPMLRHLFPKATRYFEPFVGGGAMLPFRPCEAGVAGDVITELIDLWKVIKEEPEQTAAEYEARWERLQREGHTAYYAIRDDFNRTRNPHDFLFLTRTCVNGLIRFNSDKEFNNSLHHTRPGIAPQRLREIVRKWSEVIQKVDFRTADYRETLADVQAGDLVFLDPPYGGTRGRYWQEKFDLAAFYGELERLNQIGAKWVLTFDGMAGERCYAAAPPENLHAAKLALPTGNSPFTKLMRTGLDAVVGSVYLNFEPPTKLLRAFDEQRDEERTLATGLHMQQGRLFA